jgi:hypothetical protein
VAARLQPERLSADLVEQGVRGFQLARRKLDALRLHTKQSESTAARASDETS